jgi:Tol biopolymer transport system component
MPEDTNEDIRERLFEAAWEEPAYAPNRERTVARARRRVAATIVGGVLAAVAATLVVVSALPNLTEERTGTFPAPIDDREFVVDVDTGAVRELHSIQDDAWVFELSPSGDRIAFESSVDGTPQIWVADPDGSHAEPVTAEPHQATDPDWSPDGRSIVYVGLRGSSGRDLFLLDLVSGRTRRLTLTDEDEWNPDWSPDGRRILYTVPIQAAPLGVEPEGSLGASSELRMIDVRTRVVTTVAGGPRNMALDGSWFSDDRVVYMKGFEVGLYDPSRFALVSSSPDGSDRQEIAQVPTDHLAWEAAVSPDGTRIAFASDLDHTQWILVHDLETGVTERVIPGWYPMWLDDDTLLVQRNPGA